MEGTYFDKLSEIFPNRSEHQIQDVINMVNADFSDEEWEYLLERMINLLAESGDSALYNNEELGEAAGYGYDNGDISTKIARKESIFEQLCDMIPDADPDYLMKQAESLVDATGNEMDEFIDRALTKHDYPNKKNYLKKQRLIDELQLYTSAFNLEDYLTIIPDPFAQFTSSTYESALSNTSAKDDEDFAIKHLLNCFPYIRERDVKKVFNKLGKNVIKTSNMLARMPRHFKTPRKSIPIDEECENVQLLQEIAFINHKQELRIAMKMKDQYYRIARAEAEKYNLLETCQCCFFEGLLPEECYFCQKNCAFCKECVAKGAEHIIGKGELVFPCLSTCNAFFDLPTLRMVLDKKIFNPLLDKIQMEEVKNANIIGLETCPFCDFSMILSDNEKIFKCQNIECMEETCRECKHKSHIPLRCDEIEYDEDVKKRTYIENKMTEALVRICWKCNKSFLKESGCNKMTCSCGAKMCYICGSANIDYGHFGELKHGRCPLYTQDLKQFHAERVLNSARLAKAELGVDKNPALLKIDPTEGVEEFLG